MLLIDEEFDARKLEELAESLLADITADMEAGDGAGNENDAKIASCTERLSGPVVGTKTKCLESSQHTKTRSNSINDPDWVDPVQADTIRLQNNLHAATQHLTNTINAPITIASAVTPIKLHQVKVEDSPPSPLDTVYGTYDAKTNSITIVMDDDIVPVNEAVEEIYCDGVTPSKNDEIKYPSPAASPSHVFLNVVDDSDDDDDLIERFLRPKRPLAKSPAPSLHSAASDHGYESIIGSPTSTATEHFDTGAEDFVWQGSFNDLFPSLI
ncbi:PREDICTED: uncharacterized protein LOC108359436 isoform X2 [Rhagoletis zephyria]|uniref:uncharacterized protein LOC108359436 isoform X2 n=1 Tax=Rhagoletis zephyria TaxID=28612 RepID=UPI00081167CF|nr:PREDICTED: uncharacterized protein LOC108359436 isoform X2 [Rhagoletis zephyria]